MVSFAGIANDLRDEEKSWNQHAPVFVEEIVSHDQQKYQRAI